MPRKITRLCFTTNLFFNIIMATTVHTNVKDLFFLKLYARSATVIGIFSFTTKSSSKKINYSLLYNIILMGIWSAGALVSTYQRITNPQAHVTTFEDCLDDAYNLLLCALFIGGILRNIRHPNLKQNILNKLAIFDKKCFIVNIDSQCHMWSILKYVCSHVFCPLLSIADFILWSNMIQFNEIFLYFLEYLGMYYEFFLISFLWELATVIECRYKYIKVKLKTLLTKNLTSHTIFILQINEIKTLYKLLYEAIKQVNLLFGFALLIIFSHLVLLFLINFFWLAFLTPISRTDLIVLGSILDPAIIVVSTKIQL